MNDPRLSTGLLKDTATEEELSTLRKEMTQAQRGHLRFSWWALLGAIEEWSKRRKDLEEEKSVPNEGESSW